MHKLKRKIIFWKNYLLHGSIDAYFWDDFYNMTDDLCEILEYEDRQLKGAAQCKHNKQKGIK